MKSIIIILFIIANCNCAPNKDKIKQNNISVNLEIDNVEYIIVQNDNHLFEIHDKDSLNNRIKNINNARKTYIKFGSSKWLNIYDKANKSIFKCFYNGKYLKVDGVVYKVDDIIID